jgi:hypothetical protein
VDVRVPLLLVEAQGFGAVQQGFQSDTQFKTSQVNAEAHVRSDAKGYGELLLRTSDLE